MTTKRSWLFICVLLLSFTGVASHAESWHTAKIKNIYPLSNGSFVLIFVSDSAACTSGTSEKYHYVSAGANGVNADGVKLMMATALMALATDRTISIAFDEASSSCYINRLITIN